MIVRIATTAALLLAAPLAAREPVATTGGAVAGTMVDGGKVEAWLGIPFSAPPVGDRRWKAPQPAATWKDVYQATRFAPSCMQPLRQHDIAYYVGDDIIAEDCLYLNVWAPAGTRADAKLPVIVYIHGGSFVAGSASKPLYRGEHLAAKGALVIGINYRLGLLGFMAHPSLTAESPHHASGDYGLLDQVAALRWVKANAAAFGGDASRVTIMGQSAGSMSIALLQTSPLAKGLFERVVGLSGSTYLSPTTDQVPSLAEGEARGRAAQVALGARDLAAMRRIPADRIVAMQNPIEWPVVDGLFLPRPPAAIFAAHQQADVPLLIGTVRDETLSPISAANTLTSYRAALTKLAGAQADAVFKLYPAADDASARLASQRLGHDIGFATMMRSWARMQGLNGKAPVYVYLFDRKHPYTAGVTFSDLDPVISGVNHTDDVPYWLGTFDTFNRFRPTRDWRLDDYRLGDRMAAAIVAFAGTGDPNGPTLGLRWPRYDAKTERMMGFGDDVRIVTWPDRDKMDALAAIGVSDLARK